MSSDILLSRLTLTGKLDENTPLEVLLSIADVHCIDYSDLNNIEQIKNLIVKINEEKVDCVSKLRRDEDYGKISHFVNPDKNVIWTKEDLETAFTFLLTFTDCRFYKDISPAFAFGSQTPDNPRSLNECVVYTVCKYYDIELDLYTKTEDMVYMLRYFLSSNDLIITSISNKLLTADIDAKKLLDIEHMIYKSLMKPTNSTSKKLTTNKNVISLKENIQENVVSINNLGVQGSDSSTENTSSILVETVFSSPATPNYVSADYQKLKKISSDVNTYYPTEDALSTYKVKNHEDAIVIASILYGIDITNDADPLSSYQLIKNGKNNTSHVMKFNCNFYIEMYSTRMLKLMLKNEGYTDEELETLEKDAMYESLQIISLSNNFYHGKKRPSLYKETLINNDPIDELDNDICISFGNLEGYVIYTYKELYELYNSSKQLYEPNDLKNKISLSFYTMKKLRYLIRNNAPESIKNDFGRLVSVLSDAFASADSLLIKIKEDINSDVIRKEVLCNFMEILIKLSMNMRGWSGKGEYPIKEAHKLEDDIIDTRVGECLAQLDIYLDAYPDICKAILILPLVKYNNGKYILGDDTNGRTIGDRIKIIKGPRSNVHSCIKLSSNWFASSSYKYCKYFEIDPKFNIEDLKQIA